MSKEDVKNCRLPAVIVTSKALQLTVQTKSLVVVKRKGPTLIVTKYDLGRGSLRARVAEKIARRKIV